MGISYLSSATRNHAVLVFNHWLRLCSVRCTVVLFEISSFYNCTRTCTSSLIVMMNGAKIGQLFPTLNMVSLAVTDNGTKFYSRIMFFICYVDMIYMILNLNTYIICFQICIISIWQIKSRVLRYYIRSESYKNFFHRQSFSTKHINYCGNISNTNTPACFFSEFTWFLAFSLSRLWYS
jgi:hypothetical protein